MPRRSDAHSFRTPHLVFWPTTCLPPLAEWESQLCIYKHPRSAALPSSVCERGETSSHRDRLAAGATLIQSHRPDELSGSQCQRIAVLRDLLAEPALLVADEPTARQDERITSA